MSRLSPPLKNALRLAAEVLAWGLFAIGAIALVRTGLAYGHDFRVFWNAGHHLIQGLPVYDVVRDGAMTFKFPPWTVAAFVPLGLLPQPTAALVWAVLQVLCIFAIAAWCVRAGISRWVLYPCLILFWGVWLVNALDGQINLIMLASVLWLYELRGAWTLSATAYILSTKIFGVIGLLGFFGANLRKKIASERAGLVLGVSVLGFLALSLLPVWSGSHYSVSEMVLKWMESASSGGPQFGNDVIRGRFNQGLPALPLKLMSVPAVNSMADRISFLAFALIALLGFWFSRKRLQGRDRFVVAMGLVAALHPLAWAHLFAFAFPLAVFAVQRSWGLRTLPARLRALRLSGMGFAMVALMTSKTMGPLGGALEFLSIKGIGVVLLSLVLISMPTGLSPTVPAPKDA